MSRDLLHDALAAVEALGARGELLRGLARLIVERRA
jgi:hypothetical protein